MNQELVVLTFYLSCNFSLLTEQSYLTITQSLHDLRLPCPCQPSWPVQALCHCSFHPISVHETWGGAQGQEREAGGYRVPRAPEGEVCRDLLGAAPSGDEVWL